MTSFHRSYSTAISWQKVKVPSCGRRHTVHRHGERNRVQRGWLEGLINFTFVLWRLTTTSWLRACFEQRIIARGTDTVTSNKHWMDNYDRGEFSHGHLGVVILILNRQLVCEGNAMVSRKHFFRKRKAKRWLHFRRLLSQREYRNWGPSRNKGVFNWFGIWSWTALTKYIGATNRRSHFPCDT